MENINLTEIPVAALSKNTKRKFIKDKAADMVVELDTDKIDWFNPTTRENRILNRVFKRFDKKYQDEKFTNLSLTEVNKLSPKEQERWFALKKNKTAGPVIGGLAAVSSLPWTLNGLLTAPIATILGFGEGTIGSKIGSHYGSKVDNRRHNLSNAELLGNLIGGAAGGTIAGFVGNVINTKFPQVSLSYGGPNRINDDFSSWNSPVKESLYGKVAQKLLHPNERAYYHGSPTKFNIQDAHMGTVNDLGLHLSKNRGTSDKMGQYVYKIYAPKQASLEMIDTWQNGINGLQGNHTLEANTWGLSAPKQAKLFNEALKNFGKGKYSPSKNLSESIDIKDNITIPMNKVVWANRPESARIALQQLRTKYDKLLKRTWTGRIIDDVDEAAIAEINKKAAEVLSNHGHKLIKYFNLNPRENLEYSYIITDPSIIRRPIESSMNTSFLATLPLIYQAPSLQN